MKKIILTSDIILNASHRTKGLRSEELLICQDGIGGYQVTLAEGNEGVIEVGKQPHCVTSVTYRVDDERVYWTSEILTPQLVINPPEQIKDLVVYLIDSNGAKIKWSAPKGNPGSTADTKVTRYHIYLSQSEIDANYGVSDLPEYRQNLVPKIPGAKEELVLTSLLSGHKYYVAIVSETIIFGKAKFSLASNVVNFLSANNDQSGTLTPKIIPINPEYIYPQGLSYAFDPETKLPLTPYNLADLSGIIDNTGVPDGTPNGGMSIIMYGLGSMPQYNRPSWDTIIDLDGAWDVEYIYVWLTRNGDIEIQSSLDGVNFNVLSFLNPTIDQGRWAKVPVNNVYAKGLKYINIAFKTSEHSIRGLLLYGKRAEKGQILGKKYKRTVPARTFDQRMGTNGFMMEDPVMVRRVATYMRCYVEQDWLVGRENSTQGAAYDNFGNVIIGVNDVKFQFQKQHIWNWDERLAAYKAAGHKVMLATNNAPVYLRPKGYSKADKAKPVDPGLEAMNLDVTSNPHNYKHFARLAYNIAARYGNNPNADPAYIQLSPGDELKVGLNLVDSLEFRNEADAFWTEANGYHNWQEQAAILSATYDGHKGALGPGFGVKAADPNLKVSMSSLAVGYNVGFLKRMMLWWNLHRGYGDYPIDIINYHHYNGSAGSQNVPVYSDIPSSGVPPEQSEFLGIADHWNDFRDSQLSTAELRLTEVGYDEQWGGVYSPDYRDQAVRSRYKGYWLMRTFLLGIAQGLDIVNQYWFANTDNRLADLDPNVKYRDVFLSSGMVEGATSAADTNRVPLTSFWYISNLMTEIAGYSYQFTMRMFGAVTANGETFSTIDPKLMAMAFKNGAGDTMIVAWLSGVGFNEGNFKLYVHPSENQVEFISMDKAEERKSSTGGLHTNITVDADEKGKYVTVRLTECPAIIKTKNVGTKRLFDPIGFQIEAISNSVVKLAWKDKNIGTNLTQIYASGLPDRDFVQVYSGYIDNGEYVFENLAEGSNYFYKIRFEESGITSNLSEALGITTLSALAPPTNLKVGSKTTSRITLQWDYTAVQEARIDEFELSRSLTVNGIYTVIANIPKGQRSYIVNGLTANTMYYFKMRVRKDFGYSEYTLGLGGTTDPESDEAPTLLSAKTNYAGDRIKMVFSKGLANPAGQHVGFSIIESFGTDGPSYISPERCSLDPLDNTILYLQLGSFVQHQGSGISLSYDKGKANLQSTNNIKVGGIPSFAVGNNKDNAALLRRKIKINFTNSSNLANVDPAGDEVWNNLVFPGHNSGDPITPNDYQKYQKKLKSSTGAATDIDYIGPFRQAERISQGPESMDSMMVLSDANFPTAVQLTGISIGEANYDFSSQSAFMNLDATKDYNVRILFSTDIYHQQVRKVEYKDWQALTFRELSVPNAPSVYLTSLKPATASVLVHDAIDGFPTVDRMNDPKVAIIYRATETTTFICGIILEEVSPE